MPSERERPVGYFSLWGRRAFRLQIIGFVLFNLLLYTWILGAHNLSTFNLGEYSTDAYHYVQDPRVNQPRSFNLPSALGQYDSQWYLRIAAKGYPKTMPVIPDSNSSILLSYAFPPLYPLLLAATNLVFNSIVVSAFILAQILLVLGFSLVYWLVLKWQASERLAAKTAWLVYVYPFSIFYRSYYSESLFLILLVIVLDALRSKQWFKTALSAGLLSLTRFVGLAGIVILALQANAARRKRKLSAPRLAGVIALALTPLLLLMLYCWHQTGNPLYFSAVQSAWGAGTPIVYDLKSLWHFGSLPWDQFHRSRIDVLSIIGFGALLIFSRKWLHQAWWQLALLLWALPLVVSDTMSASRFQIINLPLFLFVANRLSGWRYGLLVAICLIGLFYVSIYFVNWTWVN